MLIYGVILNAPLPILVCHNFGKDAAKYSNLLSFLENGSLGESVRIAGNCWCLRTETRHETNAKQFVFFFLSLTIIYLVEICF